MKRKKSKNQDTDKSKSNLVQKSKEQWLDNADVKQMFNMSESTLYRLRSKKKIPFTKLGGKILYPKSYFMVTLLKKCDDQK